MNRVWTMSVKAAVELYWERHPAERRATLFDLLMDMELMPEGRRAELDLLVGRDGDQPEQTYHVTSAMADAYFVGRGDAAAGHAVYLVAMHSVAARRAQIAFARAIAVREARKDDARLERARRIAEGAADAGDNDTPDPEKTVRWLVAECTRLNERTERLMERVSVLEGNK